MRQRHHRFRAVAAPAKRESAPSRRGWVLAACVLASAMAFIDGSALTVALPRLRAAFGADLAAVQWVLNGYVLALAALTLIGGALADVYGKARMLMIGCLGFGLASAACGLAPSVGWLIGLRIVQGISAAMLTPASLALIGATYPKEERNRAIGVWAAASALTTAGGPVLGGWLTQNFGWPYVFAINPPLALIAAALLLRFASPDRREPRRFDLVGAAILAGALGALAWALSEIGPRGGSASDWVIGGGVLIGLAGLAGYAMWERVSAAADDAAAPRAQPRLRRAEPVDADALWRIVDHVLPVVLRPDRPARPASDRCRPRLPAVHARGRVAVAPVRRARRPLRRAHDADRGAARRRACLRAGWRSASQRH